MIETCDLIVFMSLLDYVTFSLILDRQTWSLNSPGSYTCTSFFDFLDKILVIKLCISLSLSRKLRFIPRLKLLSRLLFLIGLIRMICLLCFMCVGLPRPYLQICVWCAVEIQKPIIMCLFIVVWLGSCEASHSRCLISIGFVQIISEAFCPLISEILEVILPRRLLGIVLVSLSYGAFG